MAVGSLRRRWILCWVVALLGVVMSILSARNFRAADDVRLTADFERDADKYALAIKHELTNGLAAVESAAAVFSAMERVTKEEFRRATAHLLARQSSLRALGWDQRVREVEREAHEAEVRRSGVAGYRITERSPAGELVVAGSRPEYVVVKYIEPYAGNAAAVGFDVASEPRRRAALESAAATGDVGLTSQISLVQQENAPGFLAFWPVHRRDAPADPTAPKGRVAGFAVGVFEVASVVEGVTRAAENNGIAVRIEDVTEPDSVDQLYSNQPEGTAAATAEVSSAFAHVATFEQGGRTWRIHFVPSSKRVAEQRSLLPDLALIVGLLLTALLTLYLVSVLRSNAGLEREMVRSRKAERERRRLDAKLQEAQRLESLGVLAGGIAHDFNNLLTTILGNTELALDNISPEVPAFENLEDVRLAATRAAELTDQMLAYTGARPFAPTVFELSQLVEEMSNLLEASVSKSAQLRRAFSQDPLWIEGDPTQIRQIVMNLITNASEALDDDTGVILVKTGTRHFSREALADAHLDQTPGPGSYVFMAVSDEGCGMTPVQRARVFDPFYSTKFTGRGLGLAAVLGIVRSHRGAIWVESQCAKGSTVTVAFPVAERSKHEERSSSESTREWTGSGTVLVVDDEEGLRRMATRALTRFGYDVMTAATGEEALAVFREHADEIRGVLLDATMPGMSGADTFRAMREIRPAAKILISSGYALDDLPKDHAGNLLDGFLAKPYSQSKLAQILERVLSG